MDTLHLIAAALALGLLSYLLYAMLLPENFS